MSSTLMTKLLSIMDIVLRVPPIFVVDALLVSGFGFKNFLSAFFARKSSSFDESLTPWNAEALRRLHDAFNVTTTPAPERVTDNDLDFLHQLTWISINIHCLAAAVFVFFLPVKKLINFYAWLATLGIVFMSYISNEKFVKYVLSLGDETSLTSELLSMNVTSLTTLLFNYLLQIILAVLFCYVNTCSQSILSKKVVALFFVLPANLAIYPNIRLIRVALIFSSLATASLALMYIVLNLLFNCKTIYNGIRDDILWAKNMSRHYGVYTLIDNQWTRLHVPQVLRVFWLTRLTEQAIVIVADTAHANYISSGSASVPLDPQYVWSTGKELMIRGCETVIAVLGMTSMLSSLSYQIGTMTQNFLAIEDPEDRSIGTVSAILFFILALQTGLTSMEPEKRFQRLHRNLCLLFTAILHFIHNMVSPLLFSLSASRNMSWKRHSRALLVCSFLVLFPTWFLIFLWSKNPLSTWLLAVTAFSVEVIIKVVISLLIYALFMIDAFRTTMWEGLDDYVYYVRASGNTIEFVFGIFLFFNGAYILLFESGGSIRALMMCIHAYFNIFLQAKQGWKTFMKRRQAVHKINSLPEASVEQLANFDDVCAICYQDLSSARITKCKHYFHGVCLRKWLYVQDICPLCHETLYVMTDDPSSEEIVQQFDGQEAGNGDGADLVANENRPRYNEPHVMHEHQD
ncbi:Protein TRC8 -like protein [Halotydeus destructor]|nr:Protein TRC8 -like protein [Halotydeus destructor]